MKIVFSEGAGRYFSQNSRPCPGRGTADLSLAGMEWAGFQLSRPKNSHKISVDGSEYFFLFFENQKTTVGRRLLFKAHERHMQRALGTYSSR